MPGRQGQEEKGSERDGQGQKVQGGTHQHISDVFNEFLKPVRNHQAKARKYLSSEGLPWGPWTLIPHNVADEVFPELDKREVENQELWQAFVLAYPGIVSERRVEMGDLFDPGDFPDIELLKNKWRFKVHSTAVPDPENDIRAGWSHKQMQEMQAAMRRQEDEHTRDATIEMLKRVLNPLANIEDKMDRYNGGREGRFSTKTFIGNLQKAVEQMIPGNLRDDPEIEVIRQDIIRELCDITPEELRKSDSLRSTAGKKAKDLGDKVVKVMDRYENVTFGKGLTI